MIIRPLSLSWILALLSASSVFAQDRQEPVLSNHPDLWAEDRVCPVTLSREPLVYYRDKAFVEVPEGYRLLLDADSFPRQPARLTSRPSELVPNLVKLDLSETGVLDSAAEDLQKALPYCEITR